MLLGIESILRQIKAGKATVDNVYTRAVSVPANPQARELLAAVFAPDDAFWRGLGVIPGSGVRIREAYARFDARSPVPPGLGAPHPAAAVALPLRRGPPGRQAPGGLPPVRRKMHPGPTPGPLHGLHRRRLRRGV